MKMYLGDAVYAETAGGMIKLTVSNGIQDTSTIYLEDFVYHALRKFAALPEHNGRFEKERLT